MKVPLQTDSTQEIESTLLENLKNIEFSSFEVGITSENPDKKLKTREKIISFLEKSFKAKFNSEKYDLYLLIYLERGILEIKPSNLFIEGSYNKFSRELAQTFHYCYKCKGRGCSFCNLTGKLSKESVQELIEKSCFTIFECKESKFHGCGREDKDVLMLGKGRPFVIELVEPLKRNFNLKDLEKKINSKNKDKISVQNLKFSSKERVVELKNAQFEKTYLATVICNENFSKNELNDLLNKEFQIIQKTPIRVEKRRVLKEREKHAKILEVKLLDKNSFEIKIRSSHGLYIKEFISGDQKRTEPSISNLLGKQCNCEKLDVLEIIL